MKQNTKGSAIILLVLTLVAVFALGAFAYYKYSAPEQTGGTSIQTQLSDTIGTFRTNTNTNFTTIDSEIAAITSTQATYGTAALLNSPIPVVNGGTGTTTIPSNAQFLSAAGTSPAWKTFIFGGGLVSTTTATSVQLNTTGLDPTANYAWSGNNTHAGSETFNSSTYLSEATSGVVVANVSGQVSAVQSNATGSVLRDNGTSWSSGLGTLYTSTSTTYTPTANVLAFTVPLPNASVGSIYQFALNINGPSQSLNQPGTTTIVLTGGGVSTTLAVFSWRPVAAFSIPMQGTISMMNSTSSEVVSQLNSINASVSSIISTNSALATSLNLASNPSIQIYQSGAAGSAWTFGVSSTVYMIQ